MAEWGDKMLFFDETTSLQAVQNIDLLPITLRC